jgi:hypothetical protein
MKNEPRTRHEIVPTPTTTKDFFERVMFGGHLGKRSSRQLLKDLRDKHERF